MKIEIELNKKQFKEAIIKEVASQILQQENRALFGWHHPVSDVFRERALKLLKEDKDFDKTIKDKLKKEFTSDKNIKSIAKEILKEKLEERNY